MPAEHIIPAPQLPTRFDHMVLVIAGVHSWHSLPGLRVPAM
jgi:hypothetical protein